MSLRNDIGPRLETTSSLRKMLRFWRGIWGPILTSTSSPLKDPKRARQIRVSMTNYLLALVARFQDDHPDAKLYPVTSPYLPEGQWADANDQPGVYQAQCASYVASALFASLAGMPDIWTAVRRLTTRVTRWTVPDDAALVRLMAYLKNGGISGVGWHALA